MWSKKQTHRKKAPEPSSSEIDLSTLVKKPHSCGRFESESIPLLNQMELWDDLNASEEFFSRVELNLCLLRSFCL